MSQRWSEWLQEDVNPELRSRIEKAVAPHLGREDRTEPLVEKREWEWRDLLVILSPAAGFAAAALFAIATWRRPESDTGRVAATETVMDDMLEADVGDALIDALSESRAWPGAGDSSIAEMELSLSPDFLDSLDDLNALSEQDFEEA